MSGHNPHGRLGQPAAWNPLQVPSFLPRQPQLAHMSNERSMLGAPPLGWPPLHPAETLYGYMAAAAAASAASAASSANHKAVCLLYCFAFTTILQDFKRGENNSMQKLQETHKNALKCISWRCSTVHAIWVNYLTFLVLHSAIPILTSNISHARTPFQNISFAY